MKKIFATMAIAFLVASGSISSYAQLGAAGVGSAVKAEALNENLKDSTVVNEPAKPTGEVKPKMHIKRRYIYGSGALLVVLIVAIAVRRKKSTDAANS